MKRSEIITHYKTFFGLEDMPMGENDNLMIGWAQTLLEDVKKAEGVNPWTASHVVEAVQGKKVIVIGGGMTPKEIDDILSSPFDSSIAEVYGIVDGQPAGRRLEDLKSEIETLSMPIIEDYNSFKTKRTNHERQPASFGKGKNKRRK